MQKIRYNSGNEYEIEFGNFIIVPPELKQPYCLAGDIVEVNGFKFTIERPGFYRLRACKNHPILVLPFFDKEFVCFPDEQSLDRFNFEI